MDPSSRERRSERVGRGAMRYGEYLSAVRRKKRVISYNEVFRLERENPRPTRLRLRDVHRLLTPYVSVRFFEQMRAVVPLALILAGFQVIVLESTVGGAEAITLGLLAVMAGLMCFMEGVKHGLMPFAENIGYRMPGQSSATTVLVVAFILGAAATFAEPAIGALQAMKPGGADASLLLKLLLGDYAVLLIAVVAIAVGVAVAVGLLRFSLGWRLKPLVILTLIPALALTMVVGSDPVLAPILGLAWDCGGITTGPVTVPLVLAVGIGVAAAAGKGDNPLSGFGIVTLASLFPAIAVMLTGFWLKNRGLAVDASAVTALAMPLAEWWESTPFRETTGALRAILPLVLFLWFVQAVVLRERMKKGGAIRYGVLIAIVGMILFNIGLSEGLIRLGDQAGAAAPTAFIRPVAGTGQPLYPYLIGVGLTLIFAFGLGFGATIAEPALNAMGITVENLTDGAFSRRLLVRTVAVGVGLGTAIGVAKIIFGLSMMWLLLGGYALALVLTVLSSEDFVNLAWDSAGVTTGPVTVPLILALGLGLATAVGAGDGFGILAMASIGPIAAVLVVGLWIQFSQQIDRVRDKART